MVGKKSVKDYHSNKEDLVRSMVKKYPLYSLNKLAKELPEISRHSIQRILEKNNLSTVEKRLEFSSERRFELLPVLMRVKEAALNPFRQGHPSLEGLKKPLENLREKFRDIQEEPRMRWQRAKSLAILVGLILIFWQGASFILAKPPEISLEHPNVDLNQPNARFVWEGEKLFVSGKVVPSDSQVAVNGNNVSLNGDGSFTAVVDIPMGESVLKVEAVNWRRKSRVLRLLNRLPTEEELQAMKQAEREKEEREKRETVDKAAELESKINDLLAARNANAGKEGTPRILNNQIKDEAGFSSVVGEVINLGKGDVSWVLITAHFYNQAGKVVDTKYGFATDFGQVMKPGEIAKFETQATTKGLDHYKLELSWEEGEVVGATMPEEGTGRPTTDSGGMGEGEPPLLAE